LRRGGIKVWMLTGDKFETAENIGYSCKLIDEDFHVFKLEDSNQTEQFCTEANVKFNEELMKRQKDRREKLVKKN
jgi:phospholipid-translocating ATPase